AGCATYRDVGMLTLNCPNGEKLYFRREVRGLNYDALALIKDEDYCAQPDPNKAIIFTSLDHDVLYKFVGNELHIYTMSDVRKGRTFSDKVSVILHTLTNQES